MIVSRQAREPFPHFWHLVRKLDWCLVNSALKNSAMQSFDILFIFSLMTLLNKFQSLDLRPHEAYVKLL